MAGPRTAGLVETVLRCYPARWRRRHGEEAAELAALLIRDGTPAASILWSYLGGAARERLTPRPGRRLGTIVAALLAAAVSLGVSLGLVFATASAKAASTARPGPGSHCHAVQAPSVTKEMASPRNAGARHGQSC
jgi:hypothetical protein